MFSNWQPTLLNALLLSVLLCAVSVADEKSPATVKGDSVNAALREIHDLRSEQTRLRIYHRNGHPRFAEIESRIAEIHRHELREFVTVATNASLECSEVPQYGQPSYGIILHATSSEEIAADELLLFHGGRVYRTRGTFQQLETTGEGWYFRPSVRIPKGVQFVVACIQDAPEEVENVRNGFMPNSDRARSPKRPYRTEIFGRDGKPLPANVK